MSTQPKTSKPNQLYYGDNLDVMRRHLKDESVDLCYIDPPFNSKRNYNQIYNNVGKEDAAQAQAFVDTWTWNQAAEEALDDVFTNRHGTMTRQAIAVIEGLALVLGKGSLLSYLLSMAQRVAEIHRTLKTTGSFYLHCDSSASHYLKIILDAIFCSQGGQFANEIIWQRTNAHNDAKQGRKAFGNISDTILFYTKTDNHYFQHTYTPYSAEYVNNFYKFRDPDGRRYRLSDMTGPGGAAKGNPQYEFLGVTRYWRYSKEKMQRLHDEGRVVQTKAGGVPQYKRYLDEMPGVPLQNIWTDIPPLSAQSRERLGYPTQKPEALLERIIQTSSQEGDVILDAYCGCGTTVAVAERLARRWVGIDITYQSISLILKRLEDTYGETAIKRVDLKGIPNTLQTAQILAQKADDRTRKEFEKWAILTYTNNRALINEKKGSDRGIDGVVYVQDTHSRRVPAVISVKSGHPNVAQVRDLRGVLEREKAVAGILISLEPPTKPMLMECYDAGTYENQLTGQRHPRLQIVTVEEMITQYKRCSLPLTLDPLKSTEQKDVYNRQMPIFPQYGNA